MTVTHADLSIPVESVMQRHPVSIRQDETIQNAVDRMTEHHLSALPVVDDGNHLQGIVTISDLLRVMQDAERTLDSDLAIYDTTLVVTDLIRATLGTDEVSNISTGRAITVAQGKPMHQVAKLMIEHQVHHLPVVSSDNRLLGIVSAIDFVRLAAEGT